MILFVQHLDIVILAECQLIFFPITFKHCLDLVESQLGLVLGTRERGCSPSGSGSSHPLGFDGRHNLSTSPVNKVPSDLYTLN